MSISLLLLHLFKCVMSTRQRTKKDLVPSNGVAPSKKKKMAEPPPPSTSRTRTATGSNNSPLLLIGCFLGIFCSYFVYGLLQERITKRDFGGEKFRFFMFLVSFQCIVNAAVAKGASWYKRESLSLQPLSMYSVLSLSYVGAMVTSNGALAYITYPTQVLGKSAKPIPVMVLGVLINKKKYPLIKYLCILMIVCGVGLFLYKDTPTNNDNNNNKLFNILGIGELLVFISLSLDGVTGVLQERLKSSHNVSALQLMFGVNCIAPVYLITGLLVTGEGLKALYFIGSHPEVTLNLIAFSLASAIGQLFIFTTITTYGPLTCAVFTTTRKFFTILMSVLLFGNTLFQRQWFAVCLVFIGLSIDAYIGSKKKTELTKQQQQQTQIA